MESAKPIATLPIATEGNANVGETVYAIGSPEGLEGSLSNGLITGRRVLESGVPHLQTNAAISHGSSGGPLLDSTGAVVGVVVATHADGQNLNLALPASEVFGFLKGPVNTRELWRGSSTVEEAEDAYMSASIASFSAEHQGKKIETEFLELLSQGWDKSDDRSYGRALRSSARKVGEMPEWEYLLEFTLGLCAASQASENLKAATTSTTTQERHQADLRNDKDEQLSVECYSKAIRLKPGFSPAYASLVAGLSNEGRYAEGLVVANSLVKIVARCATAYTMRAECRAHLGRGAGALADFKMATALSPNEPSTYWLLGDLYGKSKEHALAAAAYEKAIALYEDESPANNDTLGYCYGRAGYAYIGTGKYHRALDCLERAKELGSSDSLVEAGISACRERLGQ